MRFPRVDGRVVLSGPLRTRIVAARRSVAMALLALLLAGLAAFSPAAAAGYTIVRLVDGMDRPDLQCCIPFYVFYTPVISGNRVAFLSRNGPPDGIWSGDVATRALTKLVGLQTRAPGGTGNFTQFYGWPDRPLSIGGDTVTFFAADGAGKLGLYTVPVAGGAVRRIVAVGMTAPDGTAYLDLLRASTNGKLVTFSARTAAHVSGVYTATVAGKNLATVIDDGTRLDGRSDSGQDLPAVFGNFGAPVIGFGAVYFMAGGVFDPVSGPNAAFRALGGVFVNLADNATQLQALAQNHGRIIALSAAADTNKFAFLADQPAVQAAGIFEARTKDFAAKLVTTRDTVPGTARRFASFPALSYDDSGVAFMAISPTQTGSDQSIYFTAGVGQPIVRVAAGARFHQPMLGNRALSDGKIVFMDGSNFADTVYVAVPDP